MAVVSIAPSLPKSALYPQPTGSLTRYRSAVFVRPLWGGTRQQGGQQLGHDWEFAPYLTVNAAKEAIFPGQSSANLTLDYGLLAREGETSYQAWTATPYHDWYICITAFREGGIRYPLWTGVLPAHQFEVEATRVAGQSSTQSGRLTLTARGFEYLLKRRRMKLAVRVEGASTAVAIGWLPAFNERTGRGAALAGNRSANKVISIPGPDEVSFAFGSDVDGDGRAYLWSHRDIIEYLLYWTRPAEEWEPEFFLGGPDHGAFDVVGYLDGIRQRMPQDGKSVWALLERLLDRRRGIGAKFVQSVNYDQDDADNYLLPTSDPIEIRVFSMADIAARVGDIHFPANPARERITVDAGLEIQRAVVEIDSLQAYEQIVVRGPRLVSCFSVRTAGTFRALIEPAWTAAQESAYDAETSDGDAQGLTADEKRKALHYERVYRMFRLGADFTWQTGSGNKLNPLFDDDGVIDLTVNDNHWNAIHRILDWLPFPEPSDTQAETPEPRMMKPAAFVNELDEQGNQSFRWWLCNDLPTRMLEESAGLKNAAFIVHDREGLIELHFSPNHLLGRGRFDPAVSESDVAPVFNYDWMIATIAVETDVRPTVRVRTFLASSFESTTLLIDLPDAQVWIAASNTAIGTDASGLLRNYTGPWLDGRERILRDDTDELRRVAAVAKAIYGKKRTAIRVTKHGLLDVHVLGTMIVAVEINQQPTNVHAVVSERRWDFVESTTTITTAFLNLDPAGVR